MKKMHVALGCALVAVTAMVMFGGGCSKPETATGGAAAGGAAAGGAAAPKAIKLAGIVFQEDQFFRLVLFGMRDAAKKAGIELLEGNSQNKPEKEIELINTYAARKVDAILVSPLSAKGSVAAIKLAADKGIKIIAHNTPIDSDIPETYIECNAEDLGAQTGKAARQFIEQKLGGNAKIALVAFRSQVPEQSDARTRGFKSQLEGLPGVEYVAEQDAWLPEMAVRKVGDMLTANPEINLVWSANEGGTVGSVMAVKNAGKAGQIAVFGTDASDQMLQFLQADDNILQATTSQRPVEVGRLAVESAIKVLHGEPVEKQVSMTGICLRRDDPEGLKQFQALLREWQGGGN